MKKLKDFVKCIKKEKDHFKTRRTPSQLVISIFDSLDSVPEDEWNKVIPPSKGLMRHPYLTAIENSSKEEEQSWYVLMYKDNKPVGAAIFHVAVITGEDYRCSDDGKHKLEKITNTFKDKAKVRVLVCGHTHISGNHGFIYTPDITDKEAFHALADALYQIRRSEKLRGKISLQLIKDFYEDEVAASGYLGVFKYRQFKVDPNMILKIRPEWKSFDDYLNAMNKKYRKKALTTVKKGAELKTKSLSAEEIESNFDKIQMLYFNVSDKAKVRINHFDASYLLQLKLNLKEDFELIAYYLNEEMIAFSTYIYWGNNCEAHAIGMNYEQNNQYCIYQNILYDYVKVTIEKKKGMLILGRTAMEMKSNFGAEPYEMYCYVRHSGPLMNRALKPVFNYIKQTEWTQRSPFKEGDSADNDN
ncbi:MAG: N-acetyltransferase [Sporocytophaga sp.]|uniref:peptidogalycan biosysnthesis protein n=1 Tax=Sporocytophaga sp. TaxID=2231183 RepID=UPI001B09E802|nr:peptidogalycan biosysnthesis protein [Sporocytophaga sp.]MBO9702132.1 N-acetyltransferase [Sporocytophaga sp.]